MQNWKRHIFGLKDIVIFSLFSLLVGLVLGFFIAPIKKGMNIGCNNGNNYISKDEAERELHEDLEMEMNELCR
ncbi:MAG: hypothetical protein K6G58_07825 [Lachnospiraceae bacterium]|nr:hypothetical protein [Lachnospiraceae bacterium]